MASIIRSPKFGKQSKLLASKSVSAKKDDNTLISKGISIEGGEPETLAAESTDVGRDAQSQQLLEQINLELESRVAELEAKIESLQQQNERQDYSLGYQEGMKAGSEEARLELQAQADSINAILQSVHEQGQNYLQQLEQTNVEIIFAAVNKIVGKVAEESEYLLDLITEQLKRMSPQEKIIVHVTPKDYQLMTERQEFDTEQTRFDRVKFVSDDHIQYGGCIIEAEGGGLDARLEIQMQQFKDMLLDVYARSQAGDR